MNLGYLLSPLIAAGISLSLLIIVLLHRRKERSHWLLSLLLMDVTIWALVIFAMRSSPDVERALFWDRAVIFFVFAAPLLCYHFSVALTKVGRQGKLLPIGYIVLVVVLALSPTDLLLQRMEIQPYGYAPIIGPAMLPIAAFGYLLMTMAVYNFFKAYRVSSEYREKNRLLYVTIAMFFPLTGTIFEIFPTIYPTSIFGTIALCLFITVAIMKYHLLDIRVVLRKSLTYLLVSLAIAVPYVSILLLLNQILRARMEPWWVHAIIVLLLAILLRPLYSWAQHLVDRLFYQDRYDYLRALEQFSQKAQSVVNLKELSSTVTRLVSGALHTSSACLLLRSGSNNGFIIVSSIALGSPPSGVVLRNRSPLIKWLKRQQCILSSKELNIVPQLQSLPLREKNNLKQMEAKLYVPILTGPGQLSGILVLGQKLSQQPYSSEDRQLLTTLSSQMAIALENARLYNESQREVEERKRVEDALRKSEEKYRILFESKLEGVFVIDETMKLLLANQAAAEIFGFDSAEEDPKVNIFDYLAPEERERTLKIIKEDMFQKDLRQVNEFHCRKKSGEEIWISAIGALTEYQGGLAGLVSFRDITERKQAEERESEMQRELSLSSRLASIGELAAGVAHEINNPLTVIVGFSERLLRRSTNDETTEELQVIHDEAKRVATVVKNLLTFARRRQQKKEPVDVNDVVQRTLELRAYELKTGNIEVVTDLARGIPEILADSQQIQQVFLNIIVNAEQAISEANRGGKLHIKSEKARGYVRVSITDDGPGIPAEQLDKIFDPFFTTRGEKSGTGLGLSICHGIVTEHGGRIYAKSKPGKGATFFVELPVATEEMGESGVAQKEPIHRGK